MHSDMPLHMPLNTRGGIFSALACLQMLVERYLLCARQQEPDFGLGTFQWVNFTSCMNGYKGIAICTM